MLTPNLGRGSSANALAALALVLRGLVCLPDRSAQVRFGLGSDVATQERLDRTRVQSPHPSQGRVVADRNRPEVDPVLPLRLPTKTPSTCSPSISTVTC